MKLLARYDDHFIFGDEFIKAFLNYQRLSE
jgi:hypothetical protein